MIHTVERFDCGLAYAEANKTTHGQTFHAINQPYYDNKITKNVITQN